MLGSARDPSLTWRLFDAGPRRFRDALAGWPRVSRWEYATANIRSDSIVVSDGLACFERLAEPGMYHLPVVTGGYRPKQALMRG